jgi:FKBP-type peptidyl-prolyl cis-trans isomerase SlyD
MIKEHSVVSMTYVLRDENRIILDASIGRPFVFLQGYNNIIPGLEKALMGLKVGDKKFVDVKAEEAYGQYDQNLRMTVPREQFGDQMPEIGRQVQLSSATGQPFLASIVAIQNNQVMLDANHPLAGKNLFYEVEIFEIRDATPEELKQGYPQMPGMAPMPSP